MFPETRKIAIIGCAFRFPGNLADESEFWQALQSGSDLVTEVESSRWSTEVLRHAKRSEPGRSVTFSAGVLSRIDEFDADFFGISPREAAWIDPQQRLLLELAWEAMENAGLPASQLAGSDCAVYVGISGLDYGTRALDDLASFSAHSMTGSTLSIAANRLSYVFDLHGPSMAIDTACSSSLVALHQACNCLQSGDASVALVGGVNLLAHPYPFVGFTKASMLSAGGRCKTFDASGDGYVRAEGATVLLLKPYDQAINDGDRIHAVILASGANADGGRKTGLTIPSADGQIELMRNVLAKAGVPASRLAYLEAHGTGTAIGDPIETSAIAAVYGQARASDAPLPIGSVKTNLGHLEPASGMAGLVKAMMVLKHRMVPPSIHLNEPNPKIDFDNWRLRPITEPTPLHSPDGEPLVVGVNSFGFGGANAHVLLQEHAAIPRTPRVMDQSAPSLPPLLLSARNEAALKALAERYAKHLSQLTENAYYDFAYNAAYRRERLEKRLILQTSSVGEAVQQLKDFASGETPALVVRQDAPAEPGEIAFIYAGNGSQWVGMGQLLYAEHPAFAEIIDELDHKLAPHCGFSLLAALLADEAHSQIDDTAVAQALLFAIQVAITRILANAGITPFAVTGHSVGEVAAAWAAGALSLDEAILVICARSAAQAKTRGAGRMAAISLAESALRDWLAEGLWPDIEIAGINSPNNLTVSGPLTQLDSLGRTAKSRNVVFRLLDLDYAFHSRAMDPVRETLATSLTGLQASHKRERKFVSAVTGQVFSEALGAEYWWDNVRQPVRFNEAIACVLDLGCRTLVEISPHAILQRYLKECATAKSAKPQILPSLRKHDDGEDRLQELILKLHLLARHDTLKAHFPSLAEHIDLPNYPWQRERHWLPSTVEGYRLIERQRVHPLLGWRLKEVEFGWENNLDPYQQTWLADHQVGNAIVLPGAAYLEMALAASREIFGESSLEIEEIDILAPVVFDGEHARSIRFEYNVRDGAFLIRSRQRLSEDEWSVNASGRLLGAVSGYRPQSLDLPGQERSQLAHGSHYQLAHQLGLDYGPAFTGLQCTEFDDTRLCGVYHPPQAIASDTANWLLHPGIVDVCFQSLLDFFKEEIEAGLGLPLLPIKIGRTRWLKAGEVVEFRTRILRRSLRSVLAEFELLDANGQQLALLSGCRFRAASLRQEKNQQAACWEIIPIVKPTPAASTESVLPDLPPLLEELGTWFVQHEEGLKRAAFYDESQPLFDALVSAFVYEAMQLALSQGGAEFQQAIAGASQDGEARERLLAWMRELLVAEGWLKQVGEHWELTAADLPPATEIWRTLLAEYPSSTGELILVGQTGSHLAEVLLGRTDPAKLSRQLADSAQHDTLYDESLAYFGGRLAVEQLLGNIARRYPANRRLRVLEWSAGISEVPRRLNRHIDTLRVDYVLAHERIASCDHLRHEYQDQDWINVAELDAESLQLKSAQPTPECFDVVILRNRLPSSGTTDRILSWARSKLASNGLLVVVERQSDLATDLVWGPRSHPTPALIRSRLNGLGFEGVEIFHEPAGAERPVGCYLLLGKRSADADSTSSAEVARWLILADDDDSKAIADCLRADLSAQGHHALVAEAGERLLQRQSACDLLEACQDNGPFDHLLFLAAKREEDDVDLPVAGLNLVLALSAQEKPAKLTLVTRGAVPFAGSIPAAFRHPAHSALWGFGRVVMNEYPGLGCRLIDLPGNAGPAALAGHLLAECTEPDGENELIRFDEARYVLRMRPSELADKAEAQALDPRFRLDFRVPGQLRNLLWLAEHERELAPTEVEVSPMATGLNFRDIMYLMGLLPDEAVEHGFAGASLGLEFAGVVTRTGSMVSEFTPGDAVMGFGAACFSSHVITRENALTPKPEAWSFEAAATVPTVFFTVYYALKQLANLQPGERILIHGGAGGVGIAAIQLARHLGAEVFATAGSSEKRHFVKLLGADHVFDSRNLDFAEQILHATQGEGVDVVLNSLAGEAIRRNLRVLRPFGRFLELGKRDFFENTPIGLRPFKDNISYFGIDADQLLIARPDLAARLFREVMALFDSGVLSPLPYCAFPAESVVDAFRYMQQARQIGKVIVTFQGAKPQIHSIAPPTHQIRFDAQASYLVTGGLSGFGLETARWLASHGAGQILLLSRQGSQSPGAEAALASIRELGAEAIAIAGDVADYPTLQSLLARTDSKPLKGVFHAAMVIDDALMSNLDGERMRKVLLPKIKGAWNLHRLTQHMALDHFMLFSSVTTYIGNPGQANYVAGNTWLEGLANLRHALGLPATCVAWGPIGDAGYLTRNQAVKDSLASRLGAEPLGAQHALEMLGRALSSPQANISIGDFQFSALARLLPSAQGPRFDILRRQGNDTASAESLEDFRAMIEGKSPSEVSAILSRLITQEVAQILAVSPERIDPTRSLHDLGLDSLMGVELALGLEKRFGIQIPAMLLNEGPSVERIAARILERLDTSDSASDTGDTLALTAQAIAAQHGETISSAEIAATVADIEGKPGTST